MKIKSNFVALYDREDVLRLALVCMNHLVYMRVNTSGLAGTLQCVITFRDFLMKRVPHILSALCS